VHPTARSPSTTSAAPLAIAFTARVTDPGIWPYPWNPAQKRGFTPRASAIQFAVTIETPSTEAWPPDDGRIEPVVNPSTSATPRPASAMAARAVSTATAPSGRSAWRTIGLCA
jgi:hypothetical protein